MKSFKIFVLLLFVSAPVLAQELSFPEALELTLRKNYGIYISRNNLAIAENNNTAGNAGFLPSLDVDGEQSFSVNNTNQQFFDGRTINQDNARSQSLNLSAALEWTVFDGFRMFARRTELQALEELAEQEIRAQIEVAILDLAQSYYGLVLEKNLLPVYRKNLEISKKRLHIQQNSKSIGAASGLDVDQAQIDANTDSISLLEQLKRIENLKQDLVYITADTGVYERVVPENIEQDAEMNYDILLTSLQKLNSNILIARAEVQVDEALIRQAKSSYYPELSLFGNYNYNRAQNEAGFVQSSETYGPAFGVRLQFNLFNGFNDRRLVRNRELETENSRTLLSNEILLARQNLKKAFNDYTYFLRVLEIQEDNVLRARRATDIGLRQLELGIISSIDFRQIQLVLLEAENRLANARYNAKLAELQLKVLSGELSLNLTGEE